ncbi:hypothetical protein ID858_18085, partial [Xenorhabdus sp. DI]|nr:hypothetical protein [Xenorhabdus sp. 3]MBD2790395.1 hypothetical protein [Xenorhabdus sp. DI]
PEITLSHSTLYRRIREDRDAGGSLYKRLPRFGKTRWKGDKHQAGQSHTPNRVDISQRPAIADKRARTGDFEGDTMDQREHLRRNLRFSTTAVHPIVYMIVHNIFS